LPLPLAALEAAGVDPHSVRPDAMTPRLAAVLAATRDALRRELGESAQALPRQYRARQRSGLVLAALHERLLARVEHGHEIARVRAEVPAWIRLWTAWRTAVRT
jgi:phytoene/squalene synthetase